jgi:hypothetical protein
MHFSCIRLQANKPLPHSRNPTRIATLKSRCMLYFLSNILKSFPQSFWQKYQVNLVAACTTRDKLVLPLIRNKCRRFCTSLVQSLYSVSDTYFRSEGVINSSHSYNRLLSQPSSIFGNPGLIWILHHAITSSATLFRSTLPPLSATQA